MISSRGPWTVAGMRRGEAGIPVVDGRGGAAEGVAVDILDHRDSGGLVFRDDVFFFLGLEWVIRLAAAFASSKMIFCKSDGMPWKTVSLMTTGPRRSCAR